MSTFFLFKLKGVGSQGPIGRIASFQNLKEGSVADTILTQIRADIFLDLLIKAKLVQNIAG